MPNLSKKTVKDKDGNVVLPITHISAVYDDNGTSVLTLLANINELILKEIIEGYYGNGNFYNAPVINNDYVEIDGIKWATTNLGASNITDSGFYYLWGDVQGYIASQVGSEEELKYFDWNDYKYSDNGGSLESDMTKYNSIDNVTTLDSSDDAANSSLGGLWHIPTDAEFNALITATTSEWVSDYNNTGISGRLFTDTTDNSKTLFFPASGYCNNGNVNSANNLGFYWSNSLNTNDTTTSIGLSFLNNDCITDDYSRKLGYSIRAVYDGLTPTIITPGINKIYIDKTTNILYRYDGNTFVLLSAAPVSNSEIEAMWSNYNPFISE